MLTTEEIQDIERQILEKLPRLLEEDRHFRVMIEGLLTEKFPRRDEFTALLEEIKALRIESTQRFEAMDKRFEAMDKRFEALQRQMDLRFREVLDVFQDLKYSVDVQVGGLQRRAGRKLEDAVAGTLRLALERRDIHPESLVLRRKIEDTSGLIGLPGKTYEIDLWAHNEGVMFFEIQLVPEVEDVERFCEKCRLAASVLGVGEVDQVMVSLDKPEEVVEVCRALGVRLV